MKMFISFCHRDEIVIRDSNIIRLMSSKRDVGDHQPVISVSVNEIRNPKTAISPAQLWANADPILSSAKQTANIMLSSLEFSLAFLLSIQVAFPHGARNLKGSAGSNSEDTSPPRISVPPSSSFIGFAPGFRSTLSRSTQITDGLITESK